MTLGMDPLAPDASKLILILVHMTFFPQRLSVYFVNALTVLTLVCLASSYTLDNWEAQKLAKASILNTVKWNDLVTWASKEVSSVFAPVVESTRDFHFHLVAAHLRLFNATGRHPSFLARKCLVRILSVLHNLWFVFDIALCRTASHFVSLGGISPSFDHSIGCTLEQCDTKKGFACKFQFFGHPRHCQKC